MSDISIIENTFFANARYWGGLNTSLFNQGSIWSMNTGIESADLNMAWSEKPLAQDDPTPLRRIKNNFEKDGLPFWWWVFPSAKSATTIDILKAECFSFVLSLPCMLADLSLIPEGESCGAATAISRVRNQEDLNIWKDVSFAGFDFPKATSGQYNRFVKTFDLRADSPQRFFLAYANGQPVATSLLFLTEKAAGIYFVTTRAEHRQKGIGLKLTQAMMQYAKISGARFATLQSSPDGLRVYQKAGFKEYCRVDVYSL